MNRMMFCGIAAVFFALYFVAQSEACGRCGRGGSACHFAHAAPVHHAPPPVVVTPSVTNFVFASNYPGVILPPGGASLFGYSLSAQGQYIDPAQIIDRQARLTELSQQNSAAALAQFNTAAGSALALSDQFNQRNHNAAIATVAITALQNNIAATPQASALKVSINELGETKTEWLTPERDVPPEPSPLAITGLTCTKCHSRPAGNAGWSAPKDVEIGDKISRDDFNYYSELLIDGKMPPKSKLTAAQKLSQIELLRQRIAE